MAERTQQPWPDEWPSNQKRPYGQPATPEPETALDPSRPDNLRRQLLRDGSVTAATSSNMPATGINNNRDTLASRISPKALRKVESPQPPAANAQNAEPGVLDNSPKAPAPSYNLMAEMQKREAQQERSAQAHMQRQLNDMASQWRDCWQEHAEAQNNSKLLFARLLNELPKFCQQFNALLDSGEAQAAQSQAMQNSGFRPEHLPPLLRFRTDGDRSVGILDFMGLCISFILSDHRQPLRLQRLGRPPLLCGRIIALQGDILDIHSPLYDMGPSQCPSEASQTGMDLMAFELASLYIGADANAPVVLRMISANAGAGTAATMAPLPSDESFLYPRQAPRAFLARLFERIGQCGAYHETLL